MVRLSSLLVVLVVACGSDADERPARWSYLSAAIIEPNCATEACHSELTATGGVRLYSRDAGYQILLGGTTADGRNFVVPGQPDESELMRLLRGEETWRMPPDQPLPEKDIELIERWILEGAENN